MSEFMEAAEFEDIANARGYSDLAKLALESASSSVNPGRQLAIIRRFGELRVQILQKSPDAPVLLEAEGFLGNSAIPAERADLIQTGTFLALAALYDTYDQFSEHPVPLPGE